MDPYYSEPLVTLYLGDCLDVMPTLEAESIDSIVTDPPYGLGFMGKHWDHVVPGVDFWREMLRVLKPGGYLLSFAGTRTVHRFGVAIEDAGFEIRDTLMWIYASGFPKSLDVSKAMDRAAGADREVVGEKALRKMNPYAFADGKAGTVPVTAPATDLARQWQGWGTALKPAHEPIVMARKPLVGTVAQNVTRYGTGALNIDGSRIATTDKPSLHGRKATENGWDPRMSGAQEPGESEGQKLGRWPSNVLLSDPELFDEPNPGVVGSGATSLGAQAPYASFAVGRDDSVAYGDTGGYARYFLIPKADRAERERGLAGAPKQRGGSMTGPETRPDRPTNNPFRANVHPTVKPIDLMRHLVRLVTPPGGVTLDPFLGSGTTALAASEEGFRCIGIEREAEYLEIAKGRLMATPMGLGLDVPAVENRLTRR